MSENRNSKRGSGGMIFLNWFLIGLALLQGSSQFLDFAVGGFTEEPSLLNVWISLGREMTGNWAAVSITLIFLVLGSLLYYQMFKAKKVVEESSRTRQTRVFGLLVINLALCNQVYSSSSISRKAAYIAQNFPSAMIIILIVGLLAALILTFWNERRISNEFSALPPSDEPDENGVPTTPKGSISEQEAQFMWEHPVSYALRSSQHRAAERRKIKNEIKKEKLQTKSKIERERRKNDLKILQEDYRRYKTARHNRTVGIGATIISLALCVLLIIAFFISDENDVFIHFNELLSKLIDMQQFLDGADTPLTNFLWSIGVLFLFAVVGITIYILIFVTLRIFMYLIIAYDEDDDRIKRCARLIKCFVFESIDSVLRPFLFLPQLLELIENLLLNTNLDEKLEKIYPEQQKKTNSSSSNIEQNSVNPDLSVESEESEDIQ